MSTTVAEKKFFGVEYDPSIHQLTSFPADEPYERPSKPLVIENRGTYLQPFSGYSNKSDLPEGDINRLPIACYNIKPTARYRDAEVIGNKWMEKACDEALKSVQSGGGPFATCLVQIDDETNRVIRYWISWNRVTEWNDPTAHGEVTAIRQACQELGVLSLGVIHKDDPNLKLPQKSKTSHCELYSNAEPCAMCYCATRWARIDYIFFAATVYDAAAQGVGFSDEPIFNEICNNYADRRALGVFCYQCTVPNSLDSFNHYKRSHAAKY